MLSIKQAIKRFFTMPPQITCAPALPGKKGNTKIAFLTCCISALPKFNQLLLDFFNPFDSRLVLMLLYDFINAFSLALLGGMVQQKGSSNYVCCMHKAPVHCLLDFLFRKVMLKDYTREVGNKASSDFLLFQ